MPASNERQAYFPEGSRVVSNLHGTAPGVDLEAQRSDGGTCRVFALPGVPAEMREMWQGTLLAALRGLGAGGRVILRRNIKCFGAGESQLEAMLPDLIRRGRVPRVGINASRATIILRITAEGESEQECLSQIEPTVAEIRNCLGNLVFSEGDEELQDVVVAMLRRRGLTLATAEIASGGLAARWLAAASAGNGTYRGGATAADESAMVRLLTVNPATSAADNAALARKMAMGCRLHLETDFGLAIGPLPHIGGGGESGHVYLSLASAAGEHSMHVSSEIHPDILADYLAKHAINLLRLELLA